jgi:segregation and condensation protein A
VATPPDAPGAVLTPAAPPPGGARAAFEVHLDNFTGPFDLLLGLIAKHKLDITEVALAKVTDEFVAYIRASSTADGGGWDLGQASEFLVVAATLLDLKAARLLPSGEVDDDEDLALLEARDLLFARLLQYRAFKEVAAVFGERLATEGRRFPRSVPLEPHLATLLPELVMSTTPEQLAAAAAKALAPRPAPEGVGLGHLHAPPVSVREQAQVIADRLRRSRSASFRQLVSDADATLVVVARFLALLELFRDGSVAFDQVDALAELTVRWTGAEDGDVQLTDEFDEFEGAPPDAAPGQEDGR